MSKGDKTLDIRQPDDAERTAHLASRPHEDEFLALRTLVAHQPDEEAEDQGTEDKPEAETKKEEGGE